MLYHILFYILVFFLTGKRRSAAQKFLIFEKMLFLAFLGLETIGKRSGVVESVG